MRRTVIYYRKRKEVIFMRSITKAAKTSGLVISALMCVLGILLIVLPGFFAGVIGLVLGISVIVFGCSRLFAYFSGDPFRIALRADLVFGIMLIGLGIVFLTHPVSVMYIISLSAGIYMLADGASKLQTAMQAKRMGFRKWWVIVGMAALTGIMGFILMFDPGDLLMTMLGISLLSDGILNIITILTTAKYFRNIRSEMDIIDVEGHEK